VNDGHVCVSWGCCCGLRKYGKEGSSGSCDDTGLISDDFLEGVAPSIMGFGSHPLAWFRRRIAKAESERPSRTALVKLE
jgi:hypothetical protein